MKVEKIDRSSLEIVNVIEKLYIQIIVISSATGGETVGPLLARISKSWGIVSLDVARDMCPARNNVQKYTFLASDTQCTAKPFQRKKVDGIEFEKRFLKELVETMRLLNEECGVLLLDEYSRSKATCGDSCDAGGGGGPPSDKVQVSELTIQNACDVLAKRWKIKDEMSEMTFRGLLIILEHCLSFELTNNNAFAHFVDALGYHTVLFWKKAVPLLYESDMQYSTTYRDALLF
uniref:Uncharacterized protein n=1 Tax=Romanomermis culicivorax TaxID=13658 RepID=A0A915KX21_ROMCU